MANRLVSEGEDVRLLAMFNGPSPAWIAKWGWYGNQPTWRARHPTFSPAHEVQERRAQRPPFRAAPHPQIHSPAPPGAQLGPLR